MNRSAAEVVREYGPFPGIDRVNGVDPATGTTLDRIQKIDPSTGQVLDVIPAPGGGSGLAWAEGTTGVTWVGHDSIFCM